MKVYTLAEVEDCSRRYDEALARENDKRKLINHERRLLTTLCREREDRRREYLAAKTPAICQEEARTSIMP